MVSSPIRVVLLILVLAGFAASAAPNYSHVSDDAFISFRYAKNFVRGHGLVWNVGEDPPVEGYTNFLWVMIVALPLKLGGDPVAIVPAAGVLLGAATVVLIYVFSEIAIRRRSAFSLVAPALVAASAPLPNWSSSGLETPLFTFLVLAGATLYLDETLNGRRRHLSALVLFLAALTRPEGVLVFALTAAHRTLSLLPRSGIARVRQALSWFGWFAVPYGAYFIWRYSYYGFPFPNTYYAKAGGGAEQVLRGLDYLGRFVAENPWVLLAALALPNFARLPRTVLTYCVLLSTVFTGYVVLVGGDFFPLSRFFVPILPFIALLAQEGLRGIAERLERLRPLLAAAVALAIGFAFVASLQTGDVFARGREVRAAGTFKGRWLKQHASAGDSAAALAIGALGYYSELPIIDRLGLTDVHIAHSPIPDPGRGMAGHERRDLAYVLSRRPTYFFGPLDFQDRPASAALKTEFRKLYEPFLLDFAGRRLRAFRLKAEAGSRHTSDRVATSSPSSPVR